MVDHDDRGAGVCQLAASPAPTRPLPEWINYFASQNQGGKERK